MFDTYNHEIELHLFIKTHTQFYKMTNIVMDFKKATKLNLDSKLPLTCSRLGTCCHGNQVLLNAWELSLMAKEKQITPRKFRDLYCELGGMRLKFNGSTDIRGKKSCSQYIDGFGCSVHIARPLACRLFPLGRQIQNNNVHYIHQGKTFPCLDGCAGVEHLPYLSVEKYLNSQITDQHEKAQDAYLEIMQNLADIAFELLLDSGLSDSGDTQTLRVWRVMGQESTEDLKKRLGDDWIDHLVIPEIIEVTKNPLNFAQKHYELLQLEIQYAFGSIQTLEKCHEASVKVMGIAIYLARAIGTDVNALTQHWIDTAKQYGAKE